MVPDNQQQLHHTFFGFYIYWGNTLYYPNRYKTQQKCDETAADCLGALKFISDWFVTRKMLEQFHDALLANDHILFFLMKSLVKSSFLLMKWVLLVYVDLDKVNLDNE